MTARTVRQALLQMLRAAVEPVYDGQVPRGPQGRPLEQRYAVLYASAPRRSGDDLAATPTDGLVTFRVTSVGTSAEQAIDVATACSAALAGIRPVTTEAECGLVEHLTAGEARRDDDVPGEPRLFYCPDTYRVPTTRH